MCPLCSMGQQTPVAPDTIGFSVLKQCPLCTTEYGKDDLQVLDEEDGAQLVHVTCHTCKNAILAYIVESGLGLSSVGMLTDLTVLDVMRMQDKSPLSDDDMITMSHAFRDYQQDIIHYLMKRTV